MVADRRPHDLAESYRMTVVDDSMVINRVDDKDMPVGTISRNAVFQAHANFRVIHILLFNAKRELLIQRLALNRARHPGFWGSSVAGYVFAGETYEAAAARRVSQELGIFSASLSLVGKTEMNDQGSKKFIDVFTMTYDGPFNYDETHIAAIEFVDLGRLREMRANGERPFTPTFLHVLSFFEQEQHVS